MTDGDNGMRGTLDCLALGAARLWSHRPLVLWMCLGTALITLLTLAGILLPLLAAGVEIRPLLAGEMPAEPRELLVAYQGWVERLMEQGWSHLVPESPEMIAALVAAAALWTLALFVWCFFQGGLYGMLTELESEDGEGSREAGRTFFGLGRRYMWRFFGLVHLYFLYLTLALGLWVVLVALAVRGWMAWGDGALLLLGCGGSVPVIFLVVALTLWFLLARADLARPGSGVRRARLRGWQALRRRPGASLALGMFLCLASLVASGLLVPLSLALRGLLEVGSPPWFLARGVVEAVQWLIWGALATYVATTLVAFVQDPAWRRAEGAAPAGSRSRTAAGEGA